MTAEFILSTIRGVFVMFWIFYIRSIRNYIGKGNNYIYGNNKINKIFCNIQNS